MSYNMKAGTPSSIQILTVVYLIEAADWVDFAVRYVVYSNCRGILLNSQLLFDVKMKGGYHPGDLI